MTLANVRPRGPLPAHRAPASTPYGILPVTSIALSEPRRRRSRPGPAVLRLARRAAARLDGERRRRAARRRHARPGHRPGARARHGRQLDGLPRPARPRRRAAVEPGWASSGCRAAASRPGGSSTWRPAARSSTRSATGTGTRGSSTPALFPPDFPVSAPTVHGRPAVRDRSAARRRDARRPAGQLHHLAPLGRDRRHPGEQLPGPGGAGHPAVQDPAAVGAA